MNEKEKIQKIVQEFIEALWQELGDKYVIGIGLAGSFVRGDFSPSRPDVNVMLFVQEDSPKLYLKINEIFAQLAQKYRKDCNIRPRCEPERITSPFGRDKSKRDLFFKLSFLLTALKDWAEYPYNKPAYHLEGIVKDLEMVFGLNPAAEFKATCSNSWITRFITREHLKPFIERFRYTPLSYDLTQETDLFFEEVLAYGKMAVAFGAWLAGIKKGLDCSSKEDRKKILNVVFNKGESADYLSVFGPEVVEDAALILEARLHANEWKNDLEKAQKLYKAAFKLTSTLYTHGEELMKGYREN